ncbi:hypothetical protein BBW65_03525 [Helicobacter enhydrae]|uniref:Uncharacterized protein n=1 Tax=Helicobacter enhydrae TaxID=222136 RepID=A0A1B1U7P7_9HELI|nr:hypothetical protein BBW65_03525 [Helicobacter enhydrae]
MAVLINIVFKRIDIPVIIGYIVTGTIIVYVFDLHTMSELGELNEIAELGIVFLMFMIGLEFSFTRIKSMKQEVLFFGALQVCLTSVLFFCICFFVFKMGATTSSVIASAFSLSSTAIVLKSFEESKTMGREYAKNALGILIMQDIAVIPILLMVSMLGNQDQEFLPMVSQTLISAIVVLFILFVPGKFMATRILKFAADTQMDEIFVGTVLFIVLGASLLSERFGFSHSLGAFVAGMVISSSRYKYQVEADLAHFRDIFLGLFFVTVGMQVNVEFLMQHFFIIGMFLLLVMLLKIGVIFAILRVFRRSAKMSLKTALSLCQIGEFSFAIFLLARTHNIISFDTDNPLLQLCIHYKLLSEDFSVDSLQQVLTLMAILSMIATPFILKNLRAIADVFLPKKIAQESHQEVAVQMPTKIEDHIVVCGYGNFGQATVAYLKENNVKYIAIDYNLSKVEQGISAGDNVIFGNIAQKSILEQLNLQKSVAVIVAIDHTSHLQNICEIILQKAPNCRVIAKVSTESEEYDLEGLDLDLIINEKKEIAKILACRALELCDDKPKE